jgi:hypothetical protein
MSTYYNSNGDWGLGIGPIPNPQSPIPNPQSPIYYEFYSNFKFIITFLFKLIYYINMVYTGINYTDREKEFSNYLFNTFRSPNSDFMEGFQFAELMRKSNLAKVE